MHNMQNVTFTVDNGHFFLKGEAVKTKVAGLGLRGEQARGDEPQGRAGGAPTHPRAPPPDESFFPPLPVSTSLQIPSPEGFHGNRGPEGAD